MKLLLTLVLCVASLFNGTSSYPAAPESAATCTIDELTLSAGSGSESATLPPEIRASAALGTELSELHLEAGGDEGDAAALTLQLAPDGLRLALGEHESAYLLSDAEISEQLDLDLTDPVERSDFEATCQMLPPIFALLGASLRDTSFVSQAVLCAADALCEGKESVEDSVRFEGGNMPAERIDALLDTQSFLKILAALSERDIPEFRQLLRLYSLTQLPALTQKAEAGFSLPVSIYHHVDVYEGFDYTRIESGDAEDPFTDRVLECEVVEYEDFTDLTLSCVDALYSGSPTEYWLWMTHSADGDQITANTWWDYGGGIDFTMQSSREGNRRSGTCDWSLRMPGNDLEDEDYNPIPNDDLKLEYTVSEGEAAEIHLEQSCYGETVFSLALRAIPSQAEFQSGVDGLREVPVTPADFSYEALESEQSALGADVKALEQFVVQFSSEEELQGAIYSLFETLAGSI